MKSWREGGQTPSVSFLQLRNCIINGHAIPYRELRRIWSQIIETLDACNTYSSRYNALVPRWSCQESINNVLDNLEVQGIAVYWKSIPILALKEATPKNWYYMHMV